MTTAKPKAPLSTLNASTRESFIHTCGPFFEHSPWIAARTWPSRPFSSHDALHAALVATMQAATREEQLSLINAHPDLVGRLAREGRLTKESTTEQAAAGLVNLTPAEVTQFETHNAAYRAKFGFPFIICARENKKEAILAAFPIRLANSVDIEIQTALTEIAKIARLRLLDAISDN